MGTASKTPTKDLVHISDPELAYAAGLFDGEGCILRRSDRGRAAVRLRVSMTDEGVVRWLHQTFGGVFYAAPAKIEGHLDQWAWELEKRADVRQFLAALNPYLRVKRRRADDALAFIEAQYAYGPSDIAWQVAWEDLGMTK